MNTSPPPADGHASIQPSAGWYKASFISIREGFICTGIWAILAAAFISGLKLWGNHFHPGKGNISLEEWAIYIGNVLGQFLLMTIYLSAVVLYRRWKNVTSFILLDWRWWVGLLIFSVLLKNPPTGWLWVGLIYQVRLRMKRRKVR